MLARKSLGFLCYTARRCLNRIALATGWKTCANSTQLDLGGAASAKLAAMMALARRALEGLTVVLLIVFCSVGVYQTAVSLVPNIDTSVLTCLVVFVPLGLLANYWRLK